jgi:hypothetical protein
VRRKNLRLLAGLTIGVGGLFARACFAAPVPPSVTILASDGGSNGKPIAYPRLKALSDAKAMAAINAVLAERETQTRAEFDSCIESLADQGMAPGDENYSLKAAVTYLSNRYLSIDVNKSYDCGGAHPDTERNALTFDLATGAPFDWNAAFKPGFFEGAFTRLYIARYRLPKKKADADCRGFVNEGAYSPDFYLDARLGIVATFSVAHAAQGCVDDMALAPGDIAKWLKDPALRADLKAVLRK